MKWLMLVFLALLLLFCIPAAHAAEYECYTCSGCSGNISSASPGDVVKLTTDIYADSDVCINISYVNGVTFDCQNVNHIECSGSCIFGILLNASNNIIEDCSVQDFNYGMFVTGSHNLIEDVTCSGNSWAGMAILGEVTNNTVRRSNFGSNKDQDGYGILLTGNTTHNRFIQILSASNKQGISIRSSSNYNTFTDASVFLNEVYGININDSEYNVINGSTIEDNPLGIWIGENATSNLIYNNYFDNTENAQIDSGINYWNITKTPGLNIIGKYYLGGNFWSDYSGQDPDGDSLGDPPYDLGMNNYDYLPLVHPPFVITFLAPTPDNESVLGRDWFIVNASANEILETCLLEWNGTNESMNVSGRYCYSNKTDLENGNYSFRVWGNDSLGNSSVTGDMLLTIDVVIPEILNFTVNVINNTGGGMECNLTIYHADTSDVAGVYQPDGVLDEELAEGVYDFLFEAYYGDLQVLLRGVNISQNLNKTMGLDKPYPTPGFTHTYAVGSDYTISTAGVRIVYAEFLFENEDHLGVYVCGDWDFEERDCDGDWDKTAAAQNKDLDYFDIGVSGFSAFSIKQELYCGDGMCSGDEDSVSCPEDCECDAGDVRPCSVAYDGWCARGTEICEDGSWTGCPSPETEICDEEDNDCDGIIDNVDGGESVEETQCGCYAGGGSVDEVCNGIDDDCDGEIDEEGDCCENDQTRDCGPSNETGACKKGTSTCSSNVWGPCEGAVGPVDEICGNEEDDDCDGETDEGCGWDWLGLGEMGLILILVGIIMLIIIVILYLHFRSRGKELTWEELRRRWTPAYQ